MRNALRHLAVALHDSTAEHEVKEAAQHVMTAIDAEQPDALPEPEPIAAVKKPKRR